MTATTDNGHHRVRDLLRKDSDGPVMWEAYPKDPPYDEVLDATEAEALPAADPNALDSGRPARPAMLPVLPAWMRTAGGIRRNVAHVGPVLVNRTAHHGFRRGYAVRPAGWAFRGGWRLTIRLLRFAVDAETLEMQRKAAREGNGKARAYERKERHKTRRHRTAWTCAALAGIALVAGVLGSPETPLALRLILAAGVLAVLVANGTPRQDSGPEDGTGTPGLPRQDPATTLVRSDRVVTVFDKAKIPGVMTVGGTSRRDRGAEGWQAVVDLPEGTTVAESLARHQNLCSAWGIPKERLYLRRGAHEGQVHMTVFDEDPMLSPPVRTPLRDPQPRSLWDPVPIGTTVYGDPYSLVLPGTSGVWVCSAPGYGKTNFLQLILGAAALGVQVRVFIHDGKGEGDLEVYRDLADHFSQGSNDAAGRACLKMLTEVRDLRGERAGLIRRVRSERPDLMPGPQITREVTEDPTWGLPVILVLVDEFNLMVKTRSGDDIQKETVGIAEGCRSGAIVPVIAGQNFRADVLDGAQASIGSRVAFKTATPEDSNMILGKGQVGEGFNTSKWPDNYQGVAIVRPAGRQVQSGTHQVKMHLGEYEDHLAIAARAGRLRPAGVPQVRGSAAPLEQAIEAMRGENVVPVDELAGRLGLEVEALVEQLRGAGVPVEPSRQHGNRRAVRRRDLPTT